ncbi:MAG: ABC transporter permease [Vicinamibacteria bacterium]
MDQIASDLRFAGRMLVKNPGFSAVIVLTLGLGIGANTAIFTLMDQVMLRPLPVEDPQQLVLLDGPGIFSGHTENDHTFSYPMYLQLRDRGGEAFSGLVARYPSDATLGWRGRTERVQVEAVTGNYFDVLGVRPALGRAFTPDDDRTPGAHPLVMLTHGFWSRRFASDPGVVGQTLSLNGHPMTVIGVAPASFQGVEVGRVVDVFLPVTMKAALTPTWDELLDWRSRWLNVFGRVPAGRTREQASAAINVVYAQALQEDLKTLTHFSAERRTLFLAKKVGLLPGVSGVSDLRRQVTTPLVVLMGMVGLVLLIACANVANLLMARATARQKEVAIRLSLGASRGRLIRQLLVESVVLSLLGAAAGALLATWTGELLLRALPFENASRVLHSEPDLRVGLFTIVVSLLTGITFGLAPALQLTRPGVAGTLKDEAASVVGGAGGRLRRGLVVAQVALSLLLLVGAGLFARSLYNLRVLDPGFQPERLVVFSLDPALSGYDEARVQAFAQRLQEELRGVPGVANAAPTTASLMSNSVWSRTVKVEGRERKDGEDWNPQTAAVAPGFMDTVGFKVVAGRDFAATDSQDAPKVVLVNEAFARFFFSGENPVGRRIGWGRPTDTFELEIVGLVKDAKINNMRDDVPRMVYVPLAQQERVSGFAFYVRTSLPEAAVIPAVRQATARLDPQIPIYDLKTMEAEISESLFVERMVAVLSAAFGLLATLLAAVGLYGVMSYSVARRTREIGIRLALGAPRERVLTMVLREVGVLGAWGLGLGLPLSLALSRLVSAQLFGLPPHDPLTLLAATALLACVTVLAGLVPARRAMRVDPMLALRYE